MNSRCRQTDALLDATFAGTQLTRAQAAHVAGCLGCVHAMAQIHRFDGELARIGHELAPEPMPPAGELTAAAATAKEERPMRFRRTALAGGLAAVVVAFSLAGGGQWLDSAFDGVFGSGYGVPVEELNAWLDRAFPEVVAKTGREVEAGDWEPVQIEVCGRTAIAFWAEEDDHGVRAYRWAVGDPMNRLFTLRDGGLAGSLSHAEVARLRADLPICDVVLDLAPSRDEALAALDAARERWEREWHGFAGPQPIPQRDELVRSQVVDISRGAPRDFWVLLERPNQVGIDRIALSLDAAEFRVESAMNDEMRPEPFVVSAERSVSNALYYGAVADQAVRALELTGPGQTLRYPVTAPGFILDVAIDPEELSSYRFLDAEGRIRVAGEIEATCGHGSVRELWASGNKFCVSVP